MATEDDNFDIDIYGDGGGYNANDQADFKQEDTDLILDVAESAPEQAAVPNTNSKQPDSKQSAPESATGSATEYPPQTHNPTDSTQSNIVAQAGGPQGVKRKDYEGRPHPDATTALLISDLQWWITDDAIRGWANEAGCENELKDVTFNEHKVNGKSKGQAFVEFSTTTAAAATKDLIEGNHKFNISFTNPHYNPYRTLPKDTPVRRDGGRGGMAGNHNGGHPQNQNFGGGMNMGGYRGRGGYNNNRGMGMNNFGRGNYNSMGFQGGGGFQGGFQGAPMGNMPYNNFNRGAMMGGMRGNGMRGRGGNMNSMGTNMGGGMGMNQMGGMGMNQMGGMAMNPMAGGMNPMMGGMGGNNMGMQGPGFQGAPNPSFNQNYFQGAPAAAGNTGDASWNPHGAKRSRQE